MVAVGRKDEEESKKMIVGKVSAKASQTPLLPLTFPQSSRLNRLMPECH